MIENYIVECKVHQLNTLREVLMKNKQTTSSTFLDNDIWSSQGIMHLKHNDNRLYCYWDGKMNGLNIPKGEKGWSKSLLLPIGLGPDMKVVSLDDFIKKFSREDKFKRILKNE